METISPFTFNMSISRSFYEHPSENGFIATAQKIAIVTMLPLILIAVFEAIVKNMIVYNLANFCITVINLCQPGSR